MRKVLFLLILFVIPFSSASIDWLGDFGHENIAKLTNDFAEANKSGAQTVYGMTVVNEVGDDKEIISLVNKYQFPKIELPSRQDGFLANVNSYQTPLISIDPNDRESGLYYPKYGDVLVWYARPYMYASDIYNSLDQSTTTAQNEILNEAYKEEYKNFANEVLLKIENQDSEYDEDLTKKGLEIYTNISNLISGVIQPDFTKGVLLLYQYESTSNFTILDYFEEIENSFGENEIPPTLKQFREKYSTLFMHYFEAPLNCDLEKFEFRYNACGLNQVINEDTEECRNENSLLEDYEANWCSERLIGEQIGGWAEISTQINTKSNYIKPGVNFQENKLQKIINNQNIKVHDKTRLFNPNDMELLENSNLVWRSSANLFCDLNSFREDFYDSRFCTNKVSDSGCMPEDETWSYFQGEFCCGNSRYVEDDDVYYADLGLPTYAEGEFNREICDIQMADGKPIFYKEFANPNIVKHFEAGDYEYSQVLDNTQLKYYSCKSDQAYIYDDYLMPTGDSWETYKQGINRSELIELNNAGEIEQILCDNKYHKEAYFKKCLDYDGKDLFSYDQYEENDKNNLYPGESISDVEWNVEFKDYRKADNKFKLTNSHITGDKIIIQLDLISNYVRPFRYRVTSYSKIGDEEIINRTEAINISEYYPGKKTNIQIEVNAVNFTAFEFNCLETSDCQIKNVKLFKKGETDEPSICSVDRKFISYENLTKLDDSIVLYDESICERYSDHNKYIDSGIDGNLQANTCCIPSKENNITGTNGACIKGNYIDNIEQVINPYTATGFMLEYNQNEYKFISNIYVDKAIIENPYDNLTTMSIQGIESVSNNVTDIDFKQSNIRIEEVYPERTIQEIIKLKSYFPNVVFSDKIYTCNLMTDSLAQFSANQKENLDNVTLFPELVNGEFKEANNSICRQIGEFYCDIDGTFKMADTDLLQYHNFSEAGSYAYSDNISQLATVPFDIFELNEEDYNNVNTRSLSAQNKLDNLACCPANSCFDGVECIENQVQFPSIEFNYSGYHNEEKGTKYNRITSKNGQAYEFNGNAKLCVGREADALHYEETADGWVNQTVIKDFTNNYEGHCLPEQCLLPTFLLNGEQYVYESNEFATSDHKYQTGLEFIETVYKPTVDGKQFVCVPKGYYTGDYLCGANSEWTKRTGVIFNTLLQVANESDWDQYAIHCGNSSDVLVNEIDLNHASVCILTNNLDDTKGLEEASFVWATAINRPGDQFNFNNWYSELNAEQTGDISCSELYANSTNKQKITCGSFEHLGNTFDITLDNELKIVYLSKGAETFFDRFYIFGISEFMNWLLGFFGDTPSEQVENVQLELQKINNMQNAYVQVNGDKSIKLIERIKREIKIDQFEAYGHREGEFEFDIEFNNIEDSSIKSNIENKIDQIWNDDVSVVDDILSQSISKRIRGLTTTEEWNTNRQRLRKLFAEVTDGIRIK